jgi:hypothetical protein
MIKGNEDAIFLLTVLLVMMLVVKLLDGSLV